MAIDPVAAVAWTHAFYAAGAEFAALGLADGAPVASWPDEVGSDNLANATDANQPHWDATEQAVVTDGTDMLRVNFADLAQPVAVVAVVKAGSWTTEQFMVDGFSARFMVRISTAGQYQFVAGGASNLSMGHVDDGWHVLLAYGNGASSAVEQDGVETTGNAGANALDGLTVFARSGGSLLKVAAGGGIRFVGVYEGDPRTDPGWSTFEQWVEQSCGIPIQTMTTASLTPIELVAPNNDALAVIDVDDDGKLDIVSGGDQFVEWWKQGETTEDWTKYQLSTTGVDVETLCAADFDDDGDVEVVIGEPGAGRIKLYKHGGDPTSVPWTSAIILTGVDNIKDMHALDVDGDGVPEIVYAYQGNVPGQGGVGWLDLTGADPTNPAHWTNHVMVVHPGAAWLSSSGRVDISGSGRGDIVFAARKQGVNAAEIPGVYWLEAPADPTQPWTEYTIADDDLDWNHCDTGNFCGDGTGLDVCAFKSDESDPTGEVLWFDHRHDWRPRSANITEHEETPGQDTWNLRTWPGDERDGFITVGERAIVVSEWLAPGWRTKTLAYPLNLNHPVDDRIIYADLDDDGNDEVVMADSGGDRVLVFLDETMGTS